MKFSQLYVYVIYYEGTFIRSTFVRTVPIKVIFTILLASLFEYYS